MSFSFVSKNILFGVLGISILCQVVLILVGLLNIFQRQDMLIISAIVIIISQATEILIKMTYNAKISINKLIIIQIVTVAFILINQKLRLNWLFSSVLVASATCLIYQQINLFRYQETAQLILEHRERVKATTQSN